MKTTMTFLAGAAVGYVLGTRAGQERYHEIAEGARKLSNQPAVQRAQSALKSRVAQGADGESEKPAGVTDQTTGPTGGTSSSDRSQSAATTGNTGAANWPSSKAARAAGQAAKSGSTANRSW